MNIEGFRRGRRTNFVAMAPGGREKIVTTLGPLYLGIGTAERGVASFYFYLGRVF